MLHFMMMRAKGYVMTREEEKYMEELHAFQLQINEFEVRPEEANEGCRPKETINYTM